VAYLGVLHLLERGLWPSGWPVLTHGLVLAGVGVAITLLTRALGNPGDVELLVDNIHVSGGAEDLRRLPSLVPVSLLCIAAGGALGPEAPLVQTTGTVGSGAARRAGLDAGATRIVTLAGMASGFTVLFGAPLGSAVFALEILHRRGLEYYEALMPAVLGSVAGYAVHLVASGAGLAPVWDLPEAGPLGPADLGWALACGVVGAGVAAAFVAVHRLLRAASERLPPGGRPLAGGVALGLLAAVSPYALTFGEAQLGRVTSTRLALGALGLAAAAKLLGSTVSLATGWKGGFIIPLFFVGAALGRAGHLLVPGADEAVLVAGLMVACAVGVTKTPIGSVLVVTEMAGLTLLPPVLVASVVTLALTSRLSMIESQRGRVEPATGHPPVGERSDG